MLSHTRVSGIADVVRIAQAIKAPGIDPRTWHSYAVVDAVGIDTEGVFVDVTLLPSEQQLTARVGAEYSGPGFGFYVPIDVDDEVLVGLPDGDAQHGLVVLRRMFSASDNLPQEAIDHPADLVLVVKNGQSMRIAVSGGGQVVLGSVDATLGVARMTDKVSVDLATLQAILDLRYQQVPPLGLLPMTLPVAAAAVAVTKADPDVALGEIATIASASSQVVAS